MGIRSEPARFRRSVVFRSHGRICLGTAGMIAVDNALYSQIMSVLRSVEWVHPQAHEAADRLQLAGLESATREFSLETNLPTLLRQQA